MRIDYLSNVFEFMTHNLTCQRMIAQQSLVADVDVFQLISLHHLFFGLNYDNEVLLLF